MTATSRLVGIIAAHVVEYVTVWDEAVCRCGEVMDEADHPAHVAAAVEAAADLAVIELPEPEVDRVGCKGWAEFQVYCAPGSDKVRIAPEDHRQTIEDAREIAAGILAAAKAAEAVSDR